MATGLLEENVETPADAIRVESRGLRVEQTLQFGKALFLDGLVDLVAKFRARRSGPPRIFEREGACEPDLFDEAYRRAEILVGFTGKSDDSAMSGRAVRSFLISAK